MIGFALGSAFDPAELAAIFAAHRRMQIADFLSSESAQALLADLSQSGAWKLAANRGEQIIDFDAARQEALTPEQWAKLDQAVALGGRYGFQFRYDTIRLPKEKGLAPASPALAEFADFLSSPVMVAFFRRLTGAGDIDFADAHASRYRAGHFLTTHDDAQAEMGRRAAYVLNLSPEWRPDWGGLLLFYDAHGNVVRGFTPRFNSLNIFAVPQAHSVSWVTPLAAAPRYAVTGWLRARER
jgi:SM-20-related protein